jgi:hypothetical protein
MRSDRASTIAGCSGQEAFRTLAANRFGTWSRRSWYQGPEAVHPDDVPRRMQEDIFVPGFRSKFRLDRDAGVFAMGSCFARVVEDAFQAQGAPILSRQDDLCVDPLFAMANPHVRPAEFVNRYNLGSMYAELQRLLDPASDLADDALVGAVDEDRCSDLHYYDYWCVSADRASVIQRRRRIREAYAAIRTAPVIVLTLGLIEAWFDTESGLYLNVTPRREMVDARPGRFEFRVLGYPENVSYLRQIYDLLRRFGHDAFRIVVTVSPVPLASTFTSDDVVVANARSKCTLRAAAEDFARMFPNVDYFPSFEIAMGTRPETAFLHDGRHPTRALSERIVRVFRDAYYSDDDR